MYRRRSATARDVRSPISAAHHAQSQAHRQQARVSRACRIFKTALKVVVPRVWPLIEPLPSRRLPTTLAATDESNGGLGTKITFERVIVMPNGHRYVEGVTPKQLPAPEASHVLPNSAQPTTDPSEIN